MPETQSGGRQAAVFFILFIIWGTGVVSADITLPDGGRYHGALKDGRLHGNGRLVWPNGDSYEGQFRDGLMHGRGVFIGAAGDRYEGQMADGKLHGEGVKVYPDGSRYEGEFAQGYESGHGTMSWSQGSTYTGDFRYGHPWGQGRKVYVDGIVYEGNFEHGWEHGEGDMKLTDGTRYNGRFEHGEPIEGRWEDGTGETYEGGFLDWLFSGEGTYTTADGGRYSGVFEGGYLTSQGVHDAADGSRYEGKFEMSMYNGEGRLISADGIVKEGVFSWGEYEGPSKTLADAIMEGAASLFGSLFPSGGIAEIDPEELLVERALYLQSNLLNEAIGGLAPERPDVIDLYAVHAAGHGAQEVFRREVEFVRKLFEERLGAQGRIVTLVNSRTSIDRFPMATRESIRRTLTAVAEIMNPDQDILFLYLTSHGSRKHQFSIEQNGMELPDLSATELGAMLRELDLRYKVVVVSACYSGGFIPHLRDEHTLIMTAARADRQSFGCADENELTDFGRALLEDGLGSATSFVTAFERAVERVNELENERGLEHSHPQIHRQPEVEAQLRAWREQRGK